MRTVLNKGGKWLKNKLENSREQRREKQWQKNAGKKDENGQSTV